ncbi:MAG: 16S rRNA (guanine(966)-N(2))-methyltransferase RsmD [Bacilli bacterium]
MRIISGKFKGKKLIGFDIEGTRPTMDRIKESLFGMIQSNLKNSVCLDLFAGSGSLGLEALSNGAKCCYFVDNNKIILDILSKNLKDINNAYIIKDNYEEALKQFKKLNIKFDLVFLDPPYLLNLINNSLLNLIELDLLSKEAIIVCEYTQEKINNYDLNLIKEKQYKDKIIKIYQK